MVYMDADSEGLCSDGIEQHQGRCGMALLSTMVDMDDYITLMIRVD